MSSDDQTMAFWRALAEYRAAQSQMFALMGRDDDVDPDKAMLAAIDRYHDAARSVLAARIGAPCQMMEKLAVLTELVEAERLDGDSVANYPVLAMASLKVDLSKLMAEAAFDRTQSGWE